MNQMLIEIEPEGLPVVLVEVATAGAMGPPGPPGDGSGGGGSSDWSDITGKPATFPPTLPIAQSGVTNLVADQAAQNTAIAGKAPTVHTHSQADVTNLVADITAAKVRANHTGTQVASTISDFSAAADARVATKIINKITVASTAPGSPATNDVWIDTT